MVYESPDGGVLRYARYTKQGQPRSSIYDYSYVNHHGEYSIIIEISEMAPILLIVDIVHHRCAQVLDEGSADVQVPHRFVLCP